MKLSEKLSDRWKAALEFAKQPLSFLTLASAQDFSQAASKELL